MGREGGGDKEKKKRMDVRREVQCGKFIVVTTQLKGGRLKQ